MGISIIIPVYNEESILAANLLKLSAYLNRCGEPFQVILVDNGSTDSTARIASALERKYTWFKFTSIPQKGWVGTAFAKGVLVAKYSKIISVDMDLSVELEFILKASKLLDSGYSIVVGSKKTGVENRSILRKWVSSGYLMLAKILLGIGYRDYSMAAKAYQKKAIMPLLKNIDHESFYVTQLLYATDPSKVKEIPVLCTDTRQSKFNIVNEVFYRFFRLLSFFFSVRFQRK